MKKILSAMTESLVVVICTIAFALTAVGILASVSGRGPAGNRDFVDYWVSAPASCKPLRCSSDLAALTTASTLRSRNIVAVLGLASAVIEIGVLLGLSLLHSSFYLWNSPVWLVGIFSLRTEAAYEVEPTASAQPRHSDDG